MICEKLKSRAEWELFLKARTDGGHITKDEEKELASFIESGEYLPAVRNLLDGGSFALPEARQINKRFSEKKRTVFVFPPKDAAVQKMLAHLLLGYDRIFAGNLYSFRRDMGVRKAISDLRDTPGIAEMYSFKLDVSDYFNSVSVDKLLPMLGEVLADEPEVFALLERTLREPCAFVNGEAVEMQKGIMAGAPVSAFLANLYLRDLDAHFADAGVVYARYSDDIIVFAPTEEELFAHRDCILAFLAERELGVNEKKVFVTAPGEAWTFLGFSYRNGVFDIADASVKKIKAKMRRKSRALVRWKNRKGADGERAARAFVRYFMRKFFDNGASGELTWCRWFFPVIDTADSLRVIDAYMQQCIRYIATEKRTKAQYNFRYEDMKRLGYVPLVSAYYDFVKTGQFPSV